mgnify:CR=1 FL=1
MPNEIQAKTTSGSFTISFGGTTAAASVESSLLSNANKAPAALIFVTIRSGASAPTAGGVYRIYLMRSDGTTQDNITNANIIGTIVVTNNATTDFKKSFSTDTLGPLGDSWGIIVENDTDQTVDATDGNHDFTFQYVVPEVQ